MTLVREAMLTDPKALAAGATAQEAGELLTRPEVRAVLVVDGDRLVGVVTATASSSASSPPGSTRRRRRWGTCRARRPSRLSRTCRSRTRYRLMEDEDVERSPVTEDGRLVGVLSRRAVAQARQASPDRAG